MKSNQRDVVEVARMDIEGDRLDRLLEADKVRLVVEDGRLWFDYFLKPWGTNCAYLA